LVTNNWHGKVVVVTGGSSGLGKAVAQAFARRGGQAVIAARRADALAAVADEFRADGLEVAAVAADITRAEDVERLFAKTIERFGRLDVLVNNAGRSMRRLIADTTADDFRELLELNVLALVGCTQVGRALHGRLSSHEIRRHGLLSAAPARAGSTRLARAAGLPRTHCA
jgi:NAD(P)-dependent dehydrogenase (short-subunit alcohol dehydrogenase family)